MDESISESSLLHLPAISGSKSPLHPHMHAHPLSFKGFALLILSGTLRPDSLQRSNIHTTHKCRTSPNPTACHLRGGSPETALPQRLTPSTRELRACRTSVNEGNVLGLSVSERADWGEDNPHVDAFSSWGELERWFMINV